MLRIEDGSGKHAFIGLGFNERNEAFDFNVALSDHDKYVKRDGDKEAGGGGAEVGDEGQIDIHPAVNHRLKVLPFSQLFVRQVSIFNSFFMCFGLNLVAD